MHVTIKLTSLVTYLLAPTASIRYKDVGFRVVSLGTKRHSDPGSEGNGFHTWFSEALRSRHTVAVVSGCLGSMWKTGRAHK